MPTTVSTLEALWKFLLDSPLEVKVFIALILLFTLFFHIWFTAKTASYGPTILTTFGIFGTFFGITVGLAQFDTANIQASVPSLLAGLKTAFLASIFGVGAALTLKWRDYLFGHRQRGGGATAQEDVTAADIVESLQDIGRALVGRDGESLLSQIKLARKDSNERLDSLRAAQTEALAKISDMSSKALVEGLRDVIRNFNQKINDQFGENFKELNMAVGGLLAWQDQYRTLMEATIMRLAETTRVMTKAAEDYAVVVERSKAFSEVALDLGDLVSKLDADTRQVKDLSIGLANLLREASGSLPELENKVMELTTHMANAVMQNQRTVGMALTENASIIRGAVQSASDGLTLANAEQNRQMAELIRRTKEQVATLDAALSDELTKSLTSLGRQLTALSEKFVEDYMPLTEQLQRVVEMAGARRVAR